MGMTLLKVVTTRGGGIPLNSECSVLAHPVHVMLWAQRYLF